MAKRITLSPSLKPFWSSWTISPSPFVSSSSCMTALWSAGSNFPAQRLYLRDAHAAQDILELRHNHLHALAVGLVGGALLQRAGEVVVHGQELRHRVGPDVGVDALALAV